jgi:hypothetical protein
MCVGNFETQTKFIGYQFKADLSRQGFPEGVTETAGQKDSQI